MATFTLCVLNRYHLILRSTFSRKFTNVYKYSRCRLLRNPHFASTGFLHKNDPITLFIIVINYGRWSLHFQHQFFQFPFREYMVVSVMHSTLLSLIVNPRHQHVIFREFLLTVVNREKCVVRNLFRTYIWRIIAAPFCLSFWPSWLLIGKVLFLCPDIYQPTTFWCHYPQNFFKEKQPSFLTHAKHMPYCIMVADFDL